MVRLKWNTALNSTKCMAINDQESGEKVIRFMSIYFSIFEVYFTAFRSIDIYLFIVCVYAHIGPLKFFDWVINMKKEKHNESGQCVAVLQPDI